MELLINRNPRTDPAVKLSNDYAILWFHICVIDSLVALLMCVSIDKIEVLILYLQMDSPLRALQGRTSLETWEKTVSS